MLTDAKIKGLKPPEAGQAEHPDTLVPGLRVRIGRSGAKVFILRKRVSGKVRTITLGRYHERRFALAEARRKARLLISDIEAGADPKLPSQRRGMKGVATIENLSRDYLKAKAHLRSIEEVRRIFDRYILPAIGGRMAEALTRADVTALVDAIERPTMARAVAAQLSSFYTWAMPRLPNLPVNPCRDAGKPAKAPSRDRVLADWELKLLWQALADEASAFGPAVRLLILSLQRRAEVFEADKSEFDQAARLWTIPARRAKNDQTHLVPLTPAMVTELDQLAAWTGNGALVPAQGENPKHAAMSGFSKAWGRVRTRVAELAAEQGLDVPAPFTMHDLRRTGATGMQRLGVALEVTEAVLNHRSGSRAGIVGVYQRHDFAAEKRAALSRWSDHVSKVVACAG